MPLTEDDLPELRDMPSLLTRSEAARVFGVSIDTVDRMTQRGDLEMIRLGSRARFRKRAILDALNRGVIRPARKRAS